MTDILFCPAGECTICGNEQRDRNTRERRLLEGLLIPMEPRWNRATTVNFNQSLKNVPISFWHDGQRSPRTLGPDVCRKHLSPFTITELHQALVYPIKDFGIIRSKNPGQQVTTPLRGHRHDEDGRGS